MNPDLTVPCFQDWYFQQNNFFSKEKNLSWNIIGWKIQYNERRKFIKTAVYKTSLTEISKIKYSKGSKQFLKSDIVMKI